MAKQVKHDKYCWRCCDKDTTLECSSCQRSFHLKCLKNQQQNIDDKEIWRCPVCVRLDVVNEDRLDMLPIMISRAFKQKKFDLLKHPLKNAEDNSKTDELVNLMDLTKIKDTIGTYTSFLGLIADARWIVHNSWVLFQGDHQTVKIAEELVEFLKMQIKSVKMCADCYLNKSKHPDSGFTMVCTKPHLLLWAKVSGWDYWPAKYMSTDGQTVNVRFFGDETEADVPAESCFLYSETSPTRPTKQKREPKKFKEALKDAKKYIKNIRKKFGAYHLVETKTPFDPTMLNRYLLDSIPGYANSQDPSQDNTDRKPDALPNVATEDQNRADDEAQPIQDNVQKDKTWNLYYDSDGSADAESEIGELSEQGNKPESKDDYEPMRKKFRFSDDKEGEPSEKKLVTEPNVGRVYHSIDLDSIVQVLAEEPKNAVAQPIAKVFANITNATWNVAKCREVMAESTKAFEHVCGLNTKLEEELKNLAANYERQLKDAEERNQKLMTAHDEKENGAKKLTDELTMKVGQLEASNREKTSAHNKMVSEYNQMIAKKDEERLKDVNEAKKQCKKDYARRLEANKKMKFCAACDTNKPQDTFYFCNTECQKSYWMQMDK
ncbi:MYND-type zinc finger-containing chromatin reader Zmynd8-like [Sitodiplosis mosellana]|uniref:MYND-type zinc finger-containing chromatin reader Zmynd8-like n=1 Tax=Sitodiplosis mosellana TaxID=263140 RepID=UPI0024449129|nr:MYND-type zinc finger-containing chromatin reader Zmynd8-like [Sitodiplosis mosellana]